MNTTDIRVARMGQIQVTDDGATLKAIMGSCVGIGLLWHKRGVYALSHCLLGTSPENSPRLNAKYVNDAIPMMLEAMQVESRRDRYALQAVVVGGGTMLQENGNPAGEDIGPANLQAAKSYLKEHEIQITRIQNAAENASQLFIDGKTGKYEIVLIPKLVVEAS